jgi:ketosteroid isomerase-like protein
MEDVKQLVEKAYDSWNSKDRQGWLAFCDEDTVFKGPGGVGGRGPDGGQMFWSLWQDAFPDNRAEITVGVVEGNEAMQESVFSGTHTGVLHAPGGDIPGTGKQVSIPYALAVSFQDGKWTSFRIYFDLLELLTQLGVMPEAAASPGG